MRITLEQVRHVAELARLELTDDELATFTGQLDTILAYVAQLDELSTADVEATSHVVPIPCPRREDAEQPSVERAAILGQAPQQDGEHFVVPKIID